MGDVYFEVTVGVSVHRKLVGSTVSFAGYITMSGVPCSD